ncbi:hypothetical protein Tco_0158370 [Tanacetum coccineum]
MEEGEGNENCRRASGPKIDIGKITICYDDVDDNTIAITPIVVNSDDDNPLSDDDSPYGEDIDYVDASSPDVEIVSLEVVEIVYPEVRRIDDDILFNIRKTIRSSGNTTTHVDFSQYDSFIFDLSNDQFPPTDRSDLNHEEFADELAHIISPSEYDHFCFKIEPELGNLTMDVVEDIFQTRDPCYVLMDFRIVEGSRVRSNPHDFTSSASVWESTYPKSND